MLLRSAQNRHLLLRRLFSAPTPAPSSSSARAFHPHLARYYTAMAAAEFSVPAGGAVTPKLLFRQLFEKESSTYTYLLADVGHPDRPALLIDPVDRTVDRDLSLTKDLELKLIYALNTHCHADHVTGTGLIKTKMPIVKSIISKASGAKADLFVEAGDRVYFGNLFLERKYKDRQVRRGSSPRTSHRLPLCCHHCFQLYDDRAFLQHKHGVQFHSYASEAASCDLPLQGIDEMSKNIFLDVTNKFEKALGMPQEEKTSVNSIDISAVNQFAEVVVTTRGNATATFCETLVCHEDFKVRNRELQQKMQECARLGDLSGALGFLNHIRPRTILEYNALLYSYIQSGHASVEHLRVLYDMLGTSGLHPNVWTFNIISSGLCSLGHMESALWFMEEMCRQGYIPSFHSLSRLMKKSLRLDALDVSLSLLDYMLRYDYFPTLSVLYSLISSLSRVRRIVEAYYIFSFLLDYGIYPRVYTYNPILFALCKSGELFVALSIFCFVGKKGYAYNVYSYTALVLGFCEKKLWRDAYWTLKQMQGNGCKPSTVTYTMLIKCLCDDGKVEEALDVLDMMSKGGCNADLLVYNVIIRALCSHNMISEVCEVMQAASNKGLSPDAFSLSALAGGLVKAGKVGHAVACLSYTSNRGFPGDVVFWNIYFHCLCCDNKSKEALFLLRKKMEEGFIPNVVTYNTILKGYCKEQNIDEALQLFDHFEWPNGGPDLISFNIVLSAACKQRSSLMIQRILHCMDHTGVKLDVMSSVCLVQYFCKVRRLSDCVGVLEYICSSESINRASYNVLLRSLFKEGYKYDKISCFKEGNKSDKIS